MRTKFCPWCCVHDFPCSIFSKQTFRSILITGFFLCTEILFCFAQQEGVSINTDDSPPDSSAMLDVKSTTKGVLIPRISTTQRLSIVNPAISLVVFDSTQGNFYYYSGSTWIPISSESNSWGLTGNAGTLPSSNFIGTADANDFVLKANNTEWMRIKTNGLVGFNIPSPQHHLHLHSTVKTGTSLAHEACCEKAEREAMDTINPLPRPVDGFNYASIQFTNASTGQAINDGLIIGLTQQNAFFNLREQGNILFSAGNGTPIVLSSDGNLGWGKGLPLAKLHIQVNEAISFLKINNHSENVFEIFNKGNIQVGPNPDSTSRFFIYDDTRANTLKAVGSSNSNAIFGEGKGNTRGVFGFSETGEGVKGEGSIGVLGNAVGSGTAVKGISSTGTGGHFQTTGGTAILAEDNSDNNALIIPSGKGKAGIGTSSPTAQLHVKNSTGYNQFRLETPYKPLSPTDPSGNVGDITWGVDNQQYYLYLKIGPAQWVRTKFNSW